MPEDIIKITELPKSNDALLIAGFDGWGNALNISRGMVDYMILKTHAKPFGKINADLFYRYDKIRPMVVIEDGVLKELAPPAGFFYATPRDFSGRDLLFLKAPEPHLRWSQFVDAVLRLCQNTGVKTVISLGSMYDNVLHTDTVISALASDDNILRGFTEKNVRTISYKGPSAIHSILHREARDRGFDCISLWCHCPSYLQGTPHFGLLSHLGSLLASWGGFDLDTKELEASWKEISKQIQEIIDKDPELQGMIHDLRKAKVRGSWDTANKRDKVIRLEDFLNPR